MEEHQLDEDREKDDRQAPVAYSCAEIEFKTGEMQMSGRKKYIRANKGWAIHQSHP
jgi:hypothetical protein